MDHTVQIHVKTDTVEKNNDNATTTRPAMRDVYYPLSFHNTNMYNRYTYKRSDAPLLDIIDALFITFAIAVCIATWIPLVY